MKTVMKKMFCLMLVAVLMVGVMPFQAFATEVVNVTIKVDGADAGTAQIYAGDHNVDYIYDLCYTGDKSSVKDYAITVNGTAATGSFTAASTDAVILWIALTQCGYNGCTSTEHTASAHCTTCHWFSGHDTTCVNGCTGLVTCPQSNHQTGCLKTVVCATCSTVGGGHTDACDALCTTEVDCTNPAHKTDCKSQIVCPACAKVGGTHYDNCLVPCNETAECTSKAHKVTCLAPCTGLANCTSPSHKENCLSKLTCSYCGQKGHVSTTCPNYYYSCGCLKASGHAANCNAAKWNVTFSPNYNTTAATTLSVVNGSKLYDAYTPVRVGHTFSGWYYDDLCTNKVPADAVVTAPMTVYAKWTPNAPYPVSVIVYTNGNTKTPVVTLDLYSWALDGEITLTDLQQAIANHGIKANTNAGLTIYGPYTPSQWVSYTNNSYYKNVTEKVKINTNEATVLYTMVHNVKITKGTTDPYGAIADKTNPKTGDEIFMPVAVLGLSASALAVMFYLNNKKRAF